MGVPGEVTPEAVFDVARSRSRLLSESERREQQNCGKSRKTKRELHSQRPLEWL
jgi:hypothetical protein